MATSLKRRIPLFEAAAIRIDVFDMRSTSGVLTAQRIHGVVLDAQLAGHRGEHPAAVRAHHASSSRFRRSPPTGSPASRWQPWRWPTVSMRTCCAAGSSTPSHVQAARAAHCGPSQAAQCQRTRHPPSCRCNWRRAPRRRTPANLADCVVPPGSRGTAVAVRWPPLASAQAAVTTVQNVADRLSAISVWFARIDRRVWRVALFCVYRKTAVAASLARVIFARVAGTWLLSTPPGSKIAKRCCSRAASATDFSSRNWWRS